MKKGVGLIVIALFLSAGIASAIDVNPLYSLATVTVDSFDGDSVYPGTEDPIEWTVVASKYTAEGYPQTTLANTWPKDKYGDEPENAENLKAFAVNGSFVQRGDNWLEIRPGRGGVPTPVPLSGTVEVISVWVWGSAYDYDLDVCVIDNEGVEHRLPMGSLNFKGWRHLSTVVSKQIPQSSKQFPSKENLRLNRFIVTTNNRERSDDFYFYMDDITILSHLDHFESYDGSDLILQTKISAIWGEREQTPAPTPAATPDEPGSYPPSATSPSANAGIGTDNPAFQQLQEVSVSKMTDPVFWTPRTNRDYAIVSARAFANTPAGKQPIEGEAEAQGDDGAEDKVLGLRVDFIRRGKQDLLVKSVRPIPVEGVVKVISVWVAGRNAPHTLYLQLRDYNGNLRELEMGKLNYSGWRQLSVAIPASIKQQDKYYNDSVGLSVEGFRIAFNLEDTSNSYYVYFDDLRALTDLYPITDGRPADDPSDRW